MQKKCVEAGAKVPADFVLARYFNQKKLGYMNVNVHNRLVED